MAFLYFLCVVSLMLQMVAPYFVWANRWNVPAHVSLGFCFTAYIIPGLLTDVWGNVDSEVFFLYFYVNVLGALSLICGVLLGSKLGGAKRLSERFMPLFSRTMDIRISRRVKKAAIIGIVGLTLAYVIMGFVPIFAADPLSAKQFKGEYRDAYYRAAYIFRFSFWIIVACIPLLLSTWWVSSKKTYLWLAIIGAALIAASLARQSAAVGIITFAGFLSAWTRRTKTYLLFVAIIIPLGSAGYYLLGLLTGVESFSRAMRIDSVFDLVASGAPDILDQLKFLEGFMQIDAFTWGRTIAGGLVPGNYMWNPSVWTLTYDNVGGDISETVSGGLRLTPAMWGYVNFSWPGVIALPLLSGMLDGYMLAAIRRLPMDKSLIAAAVVMTLYATLGSQLKAFFILSIHSLPAIFCAMYFCFGYGRKMIRRIAPVKTRRDPPVESQ